MPDKKNCLTAFNIRFLGTGAADWPCEGYPEVARELLSGSFRGYSSILVNGKVLVDCGPTVPAALSVFGSGLSGLSDILITHTHRDHFSLEALEEIAETRKSPEKMNLWLEQGAMEKAASLAGMFNIQALVLGKAAGINHCSILSLPANHRVSHSRETPLHFLFSHLGKHFLYALDGSWLSTAAWKAIQNLQLDAIIWDGTIGDLPGDYRMFAHNNIPMIRMMNQTLRENGVYSPSTRIILSHLARNLHPSHHELQARLADEGMEAAHDGMEVEIGI